MAYRKVCIVGPGAIGGMMAVMMSRAGGEVCALARSRKADTINSAGITLKFGGQQLNARIKASTDPAALGPQDIVVVTLKSNAFADVAPQLGPLLKPETPIVCIMNGVPWWFFEGWGGALAGTKLMSLDPDGVMVKNLSAERIIWGVINCSVTELPDGTLEHTNAQHISLGRPTDDPAGLEAVAEVFRPGGYKTVISPNIRRDIWVKLVINVTMNLLSTVTMGTVAEMYQEPLLRENVIAIIGEMRALGAHLGIDPGESKIDRMKDAHVKTSMLQDLERGRPLELDSIAEAVVEIGERAGVAMPHTRALLGLVRVRAKTAGLV